MVFRPVADDEVEGRPAVIVHGRAPEVMTDHATPGRQIIACSRVRAHQPYGSPNMPRTDVPAHAHQQLAAARVAAVDHLDFTSSAHALSIVRASGNASSTADPAAPVRIL